MEPTPGFAANRADRQRKVKLDHASWKLDPEPKRRSAIPRAFSSGDPRLRASLCYGPLTVEPTPGFAANRADRQRKVKLDHASWKLDPQPKKLDPKPKKLDPKPPQLVCATGSQPWSPPQDLPRTRPIANEKLSLTTHPGSLIQTP